MAAGSTKWYHFTLSGLPALPWTTYNIQMIFSLFKTQPVYRPGTLITQNIANSNLEKELTISFIQNSPFFFQSRLNSPAQ